MYYPIAQINTVHYKAAIVTVTALIFSQKPSLNIEKQESNKEIPQIVVDRFSCWKLFFECKPLQLNCRASVSVTKAVIILDTESVKPAAPKVKSGSKTETHVHENRLRESGPNSKTKNKADKQQDTTHTVKLNKFLAIPMSKKI